ncbi:hypothetical protein TRVL_01636 [Trypanosoma vivax]|nr:hypothetical protein TRVL_01636 [Trypanosoma vivax]
MDTTRIAAERPFSLCKRNATQLQDFSSASITDGHLQQLCVQSFSVQSTQEFTPPPTREAVTLQLLCTHRCSPRLLIFTCCVHLRHPLIVQRLIVRRRCIRCTVSVA